MAEQVEAAGDGAPTGPPLPWRECWAKAEMALASIQIVVDNPTTQGGTLNRFVMYFRRADTFADESRIYQRRRVAAKTPRPRRSETGARRAGTACGRP
mmetsp:Transcript_12225/g.37687  ORF Transcript_12225/g.37687 Transcript_12225/m.37687 type:complete len:98 (+) Transcript_12225:308-601(+)